MAQNVLSISQLNEYIRSRITVKVLATGDQEYKDSGWTNVVVTVKVK